MYSVCLFCHSQLGTNEAIDAFPVGRRLAFDPERGRLWVVCRRCERWNLTPIEERYEAIEACDRLFRETRLRVSTDNIGLARVREGLELIRIGKALRPEMAAWRYGDQFGRRRRKYLAVAAGASLVVGGIGLLGPMTGIMAGGVGFQLSFQMLNAYRDRRIRARVAIPGSPDPIGFRLRQLRRVEIVNAGDDWILRVPLGQRGKRRLVDFATGGTPAMMGAPDAFALLTGSDALRVAGQLLPAINESGANKAGVEDAVRLLEAAPDPMKLFASFATLPRSPRRYQRRDWQATMGGGLQPNPFARRDSADYHRRLHALAPSARLALEMATHEETERRALEGELAVLEAAWREAEEIAGIADTMFVPDAVEQRVLEMKSETGTD